MAHWKKRETTFSEYGTQFSLPGAWQLRPSDEPRRWFYRSSDKRQQLTVANSDLEGYDLEEEMERAVGKARRSVDLTFRRFPDFEMSETEIGEHGEIPEAGFLGSAGNDDHRFRMWLLFHNGQLWSFFYETFRIREEEVHEHFDQFRAALQFENVRTGRKR